MPTSETAANAQSRNTETKGLNRSASNKDESKRGGQPDKKAKEAEVAKNKPAAKPPSPESQAALDQKEASAGVGLIDGASYEFRDGKGNVSLVKVDARMATFIDSSEKPFLKLSYATLSEVLITTGDKLQAAVDKYRSSGAYREAQVKQYYDVFRPGNALARNTVGSGQFRYEISLQHLTVSIATELEHVFQKLGLKALEGVAASFADKNPGMECWGTSIQIVLKAWGVVPPTMMRGEFERSYTAILKSLPDNLRRTMFGSLSALKTAGTSGVFETLRLLISKISTLEWAKFTGMSGRKPVFQLLNSAQAIADEVAKGNVVFVGAPGHFKVAVGGTAGSLTYDDPLGQWGHFLYDNKAPKFGVVVK